MAGHSKFKNIQHRKGAQDARRAKLFTRVVRDIHNAARAGADPAKNPRLSSVLIHARAINLPKDRIEKAISSALNSKEQNDSSEEVRYEGFIEGIAVIIEALTDNRNRPASQIRSVFSKYGASLGTIGSVAFLFERKGLISYRSNICSFESFFDSAIAAGALDVNMKDDEYVCYTAHDTFCGVLEHLQKAFGTCEDASVEWCAIEYIESEDRAFVEKIVKFVEALEDLGDVQKVSTNLA